MPLKLTEIHWRLEGCFSIMTRVSCFPAVRARRKHFPPLHVSSRPSASAATRLVFAGGHADAVVLCLQVNGVVLCRVVMVTVSSAHRRAKMLSPSSASKMQTFDLTWWDTITCLPLSVTLSSHAFCVLSFMKLFFSAKHPRSPSVSSYSLSFTVKHLDFLFSFG